MALEFMLMLITVWLILMTILLIITALATTKEEDKNTEAFVILGYFVPCLVVAICLIMRL